MVRPAYAHFLLSLLPALAVAGPTPVPEVDLSNGHYPLAYVSTAETEAHFNALVPRNKTYVFRATPVDAPRGTAPIIGRIWDGPIADQKALLHDHVLKVRFDGLTPATEYRLEIVDVSKYGETLADTRTFSTFDQSRKELNFVTGSCMSDEMRYEAARLKIAANILRQNPDVIVLSGDQVYVDSFDYVARNTATELDVWMRYFRSFQVNPLFRAGRLVPVLATWDDHDTGVDNGRRETPTIADARRAFLALFGSPDIPGVAENGPAKDGGVHRIVSVRGQHFIFLDNRSFRGAPDPKDRFGHLGREQERWLVRQLKTKKGFFWLVSGDMWGSELITDTHQDGTTKRLTEGFHADHPRQYRNVMNTLHRLGVPYGLISGDIHFTQLIEHGPEQKGTARYAPFRTLEIVSSAMFSIIFKGQPGKPLLWKDPQRITGVKDYNFVAVRSSALPTGAVIDATSIGVEDKTLFSLATRIETAPPYESERRKILLSGRDAIPSNNGKVKVAFFDADSTLRIARSGNPSANTPTDVVILPGVAAKIAELVKAGYFTVIVSNQEGVSHEHVKFSGEGTLEETFEGKFKIADQALRHTMALIQAQNAEAKFHYYDFGEFDKGDFYRKPDIGMGKHLERVLARHGLQIDWENSYMVGDSQYKKGEIGPDGTVGDAPSDADRRFAENLGIRHLHPQPFFGWTDRQRAAIMARDPAALEAALSCETLLAAK